MIILYHNADLDGLACALLLSKEYPDAVMHGWNYDRSLPDFHSSTYQGHELIIADLNLQTELLYKLCTQFRFVYLLDHHQQEVPLDIKNLYHYIDTSKAACELVYNYIHNFSDKSYPYWIRQIARWDIHRDKDLSGWLQCMQYQFGLKHCTTYQELSQCLRMPSKYIRWVGRQVLRYKNAMASKTEIKYGKLAYDGMTFDVSISSYPIDTDLIPRKGQSMHLVMGFNPSNMSIRTTFVSLGDLDVSEIAKDFGGGGHKKIAGCYSNIILNYLK